MLSFNYVFSMRVNVEKIVALNCFRQNGFAKPPCTWADATMKF